MAARKVGGKIDPSKMMTMIRPGELACFDEEQRKLIFEMVKDGNLTEEQAFAEVKRSKPKTFNLKHLGSAACTAKTLKASLKPEQGDASIADALERLKIIKPEPRKVAVTFSTINFRIVDDKTDDILENEPIAQIAYCTVLADKKRVAYVTSYSRLGLVWVHVFMCKNAKEATEVHEVMLDRIKTASEAKSLLPSTGISMLADVDDDEDDDSGTPINVFHVTYLGSAPVSAAEGETPIQEAVDALKDVIAAGKKGKDKAGLMAGHLVVLVISAEGVRTVERGSRDVIHNVIIKAVSYSTEVTGNRIELFAFIEVDDRRNAKTCHLFMCEKGQKGAALAICDALYKAYALAVEEAKRRAGNPFLPMGRVREKIEGPLSAVQINRKELTAIKAIGAGQFGKVFLAETPQDEQRAVKMLRGGASQEDRTEFLREAQTMLDIGTHPNLVNFIGVAVIQRPWLVVLEFCQYGDLSDVLKACQRKNISLRLQERLQWAQQLSDGMAFITSKGFVHMDLAARNCLLHANNVLKVADFGLTHRYDEGQQHYRQVGVLKLSIRWLAIDSFDHKLFSEKSDVWSFGVTLWEIFSYGIQPYKGFKLTDVLKMVRSGYRLEKPSECPADVWELMSSCWHKDRTRRPTFVALRESIGYIMTQNPGAARDIGAALNSDLDKKLKRLSVRVKSSKGGLTGGAAAPASSPAAAAAAASSEPADELIGALDASLASPSGARPKSMMLHAGAEPLLQIASDEAEEAAKEPAGDGGSSTPEPDDD